MGAFDVAFLRADDALYVPHEDGLVSREIANVILNTVLPASVCGRQDGAASGGRSRSESVRSAQEVYKT